MAKLPSCPFCGNEHPEIVSGDGVYCDQCWASAPYDSWPRRTPGPATAKMVDWAEGMLATWRARGEEPSPMFAAFVDEVKPTKPEAP